MRLVFLGTPDFAVPPLRAIAESGLYEIAAVVTQPDRPAGRGGKLAEPPVKVYARAHGIPVLQYDKIRAEGAGDLRRIAPDVMVTCAFGQILSGEILDIPPLGTYNIHASLLPEYRGAAPIQWAIIEGKRETGVTVMKTDEGVDTGDILLSMRTSIGENETAGELSERLSVLGAEAVLEALSRVSRGEISLEKQDASRATHVKMLDRSAGNIDWTADAERVRNLVRGLYPWPGTYTFFRGAALKILGARAASGAGRPGEILVSSPADGLIVACGKGALEITGLQIAGGKKMPAGEFLKGRPLPVGECFSHD